MNPVITSWLDTLHDWSNLDPKTTPTGNYFQVILFSFVLHLILYYLYPTRYFLHPIKDKANWKDETHRVRNMLGSTFHAVIASVYVLSWMYLSDWNLSLLFNEQHVALGGRPNTMDEWMWPLNCFTVGYFLYDTLVMLLHSPDSSTASYIHHVVNGAAVAAGVYFAMGRTWHFILLTAEISTPFLNGKYLLRHSDTLRDIFGILFIISFVLVRIVFGTIVTYSVWTVLSVFFVTRYEPQHQYWFMAFQTVLYICSTSLNWYWFYLIIIKVRSMTKKNKKKETVTKME